MTYLGQGDLTGVAGLAYQAVECAIIYLTDKLKKEVYSHGERKLAEELLELSKGALKDLWRTRNIDFYGNEVLGGELKELDEEQIKKTLKKSDLILAKIEKNLMK
jgi:hypothetical protein